MPRARKTADVPSVASLFEGLSSKLRQQASEPNIFGYKPHAKQELFHASLAHTRLYIGGNRSGKTVGGVIEDILWASRTHPHRELPDRPIRGRVVAVDYTNGVEKIILPVFKRWCPPSYLRGGSWEEAYDKYLRTLFFENGSFIEFMSYDQDLDKFAGTSRDFVHFDEEPPKTVYNECGARLIDTDGSAWVTMTPVEGMTWVYDDLFQPGSEGLDPDIFVVEIDMAENPYLKAEARERYLKGLDEDERRAREKGHFVQLGGLVYKQFSKDVHVVSAGTFDPRVAATQGWQFYLSIDDGWNNPTAILWHAVSPEGRIVTFSESYRSETTIKEHSEEIKRREAMWPGVPKNIIRTGDPAMKQTTAQTGVSKLYTYAENGIYLNVDNVPKDVSVGVDKIQQYLRLREDDKPMWTITDECVNLIGEMGRLRWATYSSKKLQYENNAQEKIHKKNDHACDSARYFFTLMPDLAPIIEKSGPTILQEGGTRLVSPTLRYDEALSKQLQSGGTQWKTFQGSDTYALEYDS